MKVPSAGKHTSSLKTPNSPKHAVPRSSARKAAAAMRAVSRDKTTNTIRTEPTETLNAANHTPSKDGVTRGSLIPKSAIGRKGMSYAAKAALGPAGGKLAEKAIETATRSFPENTSSSGMANPATRLSKGMLHPSLSSNGMLAHGLGRTNGLKVAKILGNPFLIAVVSGVLVVALLIFGIVLAFMMGSSSTSNTATTSNGQSKTSTITMGTSANNNAGKSANGFQSYSAATDRQKRVADIAKNSSTVDLQQNHCLAFVDDVFSEAGENITRDCCAHTAMEHATTSTDMQNIPVGACVFTGTSWGPVYCSSCGQDAGHIGIYTGDGNVTDNVGGRRTISITEWIAGVQENGGTVCWGWLSGIDLTK